MAYAFQTTFGAALAERLDPWMTDDHALYCDAIGAMFEPVFTLAYQQGVDGDPDYVPGYGTLFDVDLCPTNGLGYLAQMVGVSLPVGASDPVARALIRAASGKQRGTLASIQSAVESSISTVWAPNTAYLAGVLVQNGNPPITYLVNTGFTSGATFDTAHLGVVDITQFYGVLERTSAATSNRNAPYNLTVVVNPAHLTPPNDPAALLSSVSANKPAGILLETYFSTSPLVAQYTRNLGAITATLDLATITDVT